MATKASNQVSIVDVTDAYSVILTSEAFTFVGGTGGVGSGAACETQAVAFCGSNQCSSVTVNQSAITCPSGISATVTGSGTSSVTIKFTTTATISAACEADIPVVVDGITVHKKFSFAVAKTGATGSTGPTGAPGKSVSSIVNHYLASASATGVTVSTSGWTTTMQSTDTAKKYLWCYQTINYINPTDSKNTDPVIIGTHGATGSTGQTGATGKGIKSVTNYYLTTNVNTGITNGDTNFKTTMEATTTSNKYMWMYQLITYTDNTTSKTVAAVISTHGATGAAGKDAVTLTITSSNGTVFKNSAGSTVLTAHVYVGAVEQSITDAGVVSGSLGSIKWYKGTSTTPVATAKTLTVNASSVDNVANYTAQLEG